MYMPIYLHSNNQSCRNGYYSTSRHYYNIKVIKGIITCLRTDLGCLKPEMAVSKWH